MKKPIVRFLLAALAVVAIFLALRLYEYRVSELTKSYGGYPMPDTKESEVERIERHAAAFAEKLRRDSEAARAQRDNCLKARMDLFEFYQKLGLQPKALEPCGHDPKH